MSSKTIQCDKKLTFQECELAILRASVDLAQKKIARRVVNSPEIQEIIDMVKNFIRIKDLIAYGGQAINEELPPAERFYDKEVDLPDYDFFSPNALHHAKELADLFFAKGFTDVEAKAGQHHGTFKVYVNYMAVADITQIHPELFATLKKESVRVGGILYAPPNYLRMSMYLELSRPAGDTDRWEKVMKRLALLNKNYPITKIQCQHVQFQRRMEKKYKDKETEIYQTVKNTLIEQDVVFVGGFAISNYLRYMERNQQELVKKVADFDAIVKDPDIAATIIKNRLVDIGITPRDVKIRERPAIGEIIPPQMEIRIGADIVAVLYPPVACHSYNTIQVNGRKVKIATIDTMLSFYLAFLYANKPYYDANRIVCMAKFLFDVQQKNRLEQKGLLRRFTITCYGHQDSVEEIRAEKAKKHNELSANKDSDEYQEWFLNYKPAETMSRDGERKKATAKAEERSPLLKRKSTRRSTARGFRNNTHKRRKPRQKRRGQSPALFDPYNAKH